MPSSILLLQVPGGGCVVGGKAAFSNEELLQLVVASEVFELLGETGRRLKAVAMSAAKKWAGPEQAASGLLITYLEKNVPSAKAFLVSQQRLTLKIQSCSR